MALSPGRVGVNLSQVDLFGNIIGGGGGSGDGYTKAEADAKFLSKVDAAGVYETQTNAAATYETQAHAAATYETQTNAAATYETQSNATATYETQTHAAATYETQTHVSNTYATKSSLDVFTASVLCYADNSAVKVAFDDLDSSCGYVLCFDDQDQALPSVLPSQVGNPVKITGTNTGIKLIYTLINAIAGTHKFALRIMK